MVKVDLEHDGIGVIIKHPTGVLYSNQAGGMCCSHPEEEGYYLPLNDTFKWDDGNSFHDEICTFAPQEVSEGVIAEINDCLSGFNIYIDVPSRDARIIGRQFEQVGIEVDRDCLHELQEAWIPVRLSDGRTGVLAYVNCD